MAAGITTPISPVSLQSSHVGKSVWSPHDLEHMLQQTWKEHNIKISLLCTYTQSSTTYTSQAKHITKHCATIGACLARLAAPTADYSF